MPDFWQYPTVSMGLGPIMSIYHARYNRYLRDRDLSVKRGSRPRVWAYLGDGECDEPETLGAISLAGREKLDNLTWVINCNLQRLDGPVRGNSKIIQELEGVFRGAGWNVIKVIWGTDWDRVAQERPHGCSRSPHDGSRGRRILRLRRPRHAHRRGFRRTTSKLISEEEDADPSRQVHPRSVLQHAVNSRHLSKHLSNRQIARLKRGGHDPLKVYAAYKTASGTQGPADGHPRQDGQRLRHARRRCGEGKFTTHQQKKAERPDRCCDSATRFELPFTDDQISTNYPVLFVRRADSPEHKYVKARRNCSRRLPTAIPQQRLRAKMPALSEVRKSFERLYSADAQERRLSTTKAWVNLMTQLCRDRKDVGQVTRADRARRRADVRHAADVQDVRHVLDRSARRTRRSIRASLSEYREAKTGQILQEGINEAGSAWRASSPRAPRTARTASTRSRSTSTTRCSASSASATSHGPRPTHRCRGFLMGATAGRTTINGEGLQHEDGHSHAARP